jgi:hypothetical protein
MILQRTWSKDPHQSDFIQWSFEDKVWEARENKLDHFRVLERKVLKGDYKNNSFTIDEKLEMLSESPVPLEALGPQIVQGWKVSQPHQPLLPVLEEMPKQLVPVSSLPQAQAQAQAKPISSKSHKGKASTERQPPQSSSNRTVHAQPRQADQESLGESSSQDSLTPPMELWSNVSLSYFVPENRFYQPSLHLLVKEELSEQPILTFSDRKDQGNYSQRQPNEHPYVRQARRTTFDHPKTVGQRALEIPKGRPLFV